MDLENCVDLSSRCRFAWDFDRWKRRLERKRLVTIRGDIAVGVIKLTSRHLKTASWINQSNGQAFAICHK